MKLKNRYFLLRHGESVKNKKNVSSCWPEKIPYPLTEKGKKQAKLVAKKLQNKKIDIIFTSDLLRTMQTAAIIGKELRIRPKIDKRLREVNVGALNNKPIEEIGNFWNKDKKLSHFEYFQNRFRFAPEKGETYIQVEKRLLKFIKEIEKKYKNKNILIVGHQRPITILEKVVYRYSRKKFVENIVKKKEIKTGEIKELK